MLWAAHRGKLAGGLLSRDNAVFRSAPLDVDTHQVRNRSERGLGVVDGGWGIPFGSVLHNFEVWIARLDFLLAAVGPILSVERSQIALQDGDGAAAAGRVLGDKLTGVLAVSHVICPHDHK